MIIYKLIVIITVIVMQKFGNRDLLFLQTLAESIRNTARLIDMPYNELNTEQFVAEANGLISKLSNIQSTIIKVCQGYLKKIFLQKYSKNSKDISL